MKKLLALSVCLIFGFSLTAQKPKEEIPAAAKSGFASKFAAARNVKWSIEKPGEFEAEFVFGKVEQSAVFDAEGKLLETEIEIHQSDLPQGVKSAISKDFTGYRLDEIEKSTDAKGDVTFEMEAAKGKDKWEISFDSNGKLLAKEPLKKLKEDEKK